MANRFILVELEVHRMFAATPRYSFRKRANDQLLLSPTHAFPQEPTENCRSANYCANQRAGLRHSANIASGNWDVWKSFIRIADDLASCICRIGNAKADPAIVCQTGVIEFHL